MSNGATKFRDQQSNMPFQRKDLGGSSAGKNDGRAQNGMSSISPHKHHNLTTTGNTSSFRTDAAISGNRNQGERVLQRWVADVPEVVDGSLEPLRGKSSSTGWDQFEENGRLFGLTTDYDENIYTTTIDKNHPQYRQRLAEADKKAREIERSATSNSHVAEERITDHINMDENGLDEEDK